MTGDRKWVSPLGSGARTARSQRAARSEAYRADEARLAPYENLARMVIARRLRSGLTQEQLATRMGTSVPAISRLESGQHRPNVSTLERLAQAFGARFVVGFEDDTGERELAALVPGRNT